MYSLGAEAFARGEGRRRDASSGSQNPGRHRLMLNGSPDPGAFPNTYPAISTETGVNERFAVYRKLWEKASASG